MPEERDDPVRLLPGRGTAGPGDHRRRRLVTSPRRTSAWTPTSPSWAASRTPTSCSRGSGGEPIGVLKIANPAFSRIELEAQDAAAAFIADRSGRADRHATSSRPGTRRSPRSRCDGTVLFARIIAYLPGGTTERRRLSSRPHQVAALGDAGRPDLPRAGRLRAPRRRPRPAVGPAPRACAPSRCSAAHVADTPPPRCRRGRGRGGLAHGRRPRRRPAGAGDPRRHHRRQRGVQPAGAGACPTG